VERVERAAIAAAADPEVVADAGANSTPGEQV